jgi:hypothetical protein
MGCIPNDDLGGEMSDSTVLPPKGRLCLKKRLDELARSCESWFFGGGESRCRSPRL